MVKKIFLLSTGLTALFLLAAGAALFYFIAINPGDEIKQVNIKKILAMESPVYYRDSLSKIGVFFKDAHRQYIPYASIPENFVNSVVAAEDHNFFRHHGVDFLGLLRAVAANIKAGRVVQGGSTITQQTAKNLFKRKERSLKSKLKELFFALQLEYHYSKENILEFYANQFYVSGNGHGLGTAARYYFDKPVSDLDILECAFIAGSVKRPNYYNPFIKHSEKDALLAKARAKQRTAYVLNQLYNLGMIDAVQYQRNIDREIPFKQGKLFYSLNVIMDMVKEALATPEIEEALARHGIDNIATSGIRVYTTVEESLQRDALFALRKELSRLDIRLRGYDRQEAQQAYSTLSNNGELEVRSGSFLFGRITAVDNTSGAPTVHVAFIGRRGDALGGGHIDEAGLMSLLVPLTKWQKQRWSQADKSDLPKLLDMLQVGDLVYVSVRDVDADSGEYLLDLEKYPQIQGAVLALKKGTVRAVVGGMENHYFNRAISAKRSMGSIMKPLVFAAAIQLGWSNIDVLNNVRNIFLYQKQPYFPRPDHHSPYKQVSLSWAGVHSENLASVWLLYHLCDRLTPAQFKEVAVHLGLARQPDEFYEHYVRRIRDKYGVVVDQVGLNRVAFDLAVTELAPDLIFAGKLNENEFIKQLQYGADFDMYWSASENLAGPVYEPEKRRKLVASREELVRQGLLKNNFLECRRLRKAMQRLREDVEGGPRQLSVVKRREEAVMELPPEQGENKGRLYHNLRTDEYIFVASVPAEKAFAPVSRSELEMILASMPEESQQNFWNTILIEGGVTAPTLDLLRDNIDKNYKRLAAMPAYSEKVLYNMRDFRVLTSLRYLIGLSRALGIKSELEPVLSFPLGSNVITLMETAKLYEGLTTGRIIEGGSGEAGDLLAIIDRVENVDGELIYQPERLGEQVIDPKTSLAVSNILRNVVKFGTGRYADKNVKLHSREPEKEEQLKQIDFHMPIFGKTGTANRFSNAAFAGVVPGMAKKANGLSIDQGYTLAAYVGFDDNTPMVRGTTHVTGATGALPLWTRFANMLLNEKDYASRLDLIDLSFATDAVTGRPNEGLLWPDLGQIEVPVRVGDGRVMAAEEGASGNFSAASIMTFGELTTNDGVKPARYFRPYWEVNR